MAAIFKKMHERFELNNVKGMLLEYRLDGSVTRLSDFVDNSCREK